MHGFKHFTTFCAKGESARFHVNRFQTAIDNKTINILDRKGKRGNEKSAPTRAITVGHCSNSVATKREERCNMTANSKHMSRCMCTKKHSTNGILEGSDDGKWKSTYIGQHINNNFIHSVNPHCPNKRLQTETKQKSTKTSYVLRKNKKSRRSHLPGQMTDAKYVTISVFPIVYI
jgi:hypothetical protein